MKFLVSLFLTLFLVSCGTEGFEMPATTPTPTDTASSEAVTSPAIDQLQEYRLGAGDKLRVIVFNEADLSGEFVVDGTGHVSLPLIGEVLAADLTVREFQRSVEAALAEGFLNNPQVSAEVLNYRPFYILGEVNKPGTYPYSDGLTVLNAVATSEGFTYRANQKIVFIRRAGEEKEQKYRLESTTLVQPGDTIRIGERLF
ncbi:MAG: polysaccharide biosynthesis/export family protein [bacterium]